MPNTLSSKARALLEKAALVHLATVMKDGSPQVSPVWVDTDGTNILVNTAEGRIKTRNVRRDARVALSLTDPDNQYATLLIRGRVVEVRAQGAKEHIDKLSQKYVKRAYTHRPGELRLILVIKPERVGGSGA
ncbi:MAG: PPOX class F420-dependent oxidoreductase [Dehalococcoidia bacterium]|nr:PPOX class F420-dependent oxidoreductase [Dehalococcoidia bacterium]